MQMFWSWLRRFFSHPTLVPIPVRSRSREFEQLEERTLMAAGPRVTDVFADNRGQVVLTVDAKLDKQSVNNKSVRITDAEGQRQKARVSYAPKTRQITVTAADVEADTSYTIRLLSKRIQDARGNRLDGEFRGASKPSGNGKAGGDFVATATASKKTVARFTTDYGNIDVSLFNKQTPLTVANFLAYANDGAWDNTIIHRSVPGFVVQGGGSTVSDDNEIETVTSRPAVKNEPHPNDPGNVRGTIAMAKVGGDPNSATNQWFFNLADNRENLDNQNGGFTAFGRILGKAGLKTIDRIAKVQRLGELPIRNPDAFLKRNPEINEPDFEPNFIPDEDFVLISRVAVKVNLTKA